MEVKNTPAIEFPKKIELAPAEPVKVQIPLKENNHKFQDNATTEALADKVKVMNDFLAPTTTAVKFQFHEELNEYYVQVIDPITEEVLKEIPNKKFLDMYASMTEFLGLMVDEKS